MAKLIVKDPKTGEEREMTERSFQLAGEKRGFKVVGKVQEPETEIQRIMREKKEERAAQQVKPAEHPVTSEEEVKPEAKKRGPKHKTTEA